MNLTGFSTHISRLLRGAWALIVALSLGSMTISCAGAGAGPAETNPREAREPAIPFEYGEIVFRQNVDSPRQVFIVGQAHRSPVTGLSGPDTLKAQTEIYRIGEWLIRERGVELLLPEGFIRKNRPESAPPAAIRCDNISLDDKSLESRLCETSRFVNADQLLKASYNVYLSQVEDEQLYRKISRLLEKACESNNSVALSEVETLQKKRTETILVNIPRAVDEAFRTGKIKNHLAMCTIGLAHIDEIVGTLKDEAPVNPGAGPGRMDGVPAAEGPKPLDDFGVTVIIPRSLVGKRELQCFSQLDADPEKPATK